MKNKSHTNFKERATPFSRERRSKIVTLILMLSFAVLVLANFGCQPNQAIINSSKKNSAIAANSAERPKDTFESALRGVQKSGFNYIFVIRRKDGEKFDKEGKVFVRENSPAETNQFVLTDEDRVVIAGSNYPFPEETLELLRKVFDVEDLSPPKPENSNNNSNIKTNNSSNKTNADSK
ncbi:MAG: hypothetical protein ABIP06_08085 [Pyrinomonadaceae bacterium]